MPGLLLYLTNLVRQGINLILGAELFIIHFFKSLNICLVKQTTVLLNLKISTASHRQILQTNGNESDRIPSDTHQTIF